ncbi:MAG: twin-arginine translocation signal domain-containing protein [Planctomycetaceae bacterium]|nr:twin-arginine translocation signal domain-containing protein [Planctomycetaceae bacterium]
MNKLSRRRFLKYGGVATAVSVFPFVETPVFASEEADTVRDRLWIWGHLEGSYDNQYGLPMNSRMTPLQGAEFLGIPNIIMVRYSNKPVPPYEEYAAQYRHVKKLMWSFVGDGGRTSAEEQEHVLELSQKMPNIAGLFMDDFFHGNAGPLDNSEAAASISVARLKEIRKRMAQLDRKPDLGVVLYAHQLNPAIRQHLEQCDLVSFWSWTADDLAKLSENFAKYRKIVPNKRTLLGIYMWDFGQGKPLPMELMKMQCNTALEWLKNGTIEGMIFLASNICDMKIEAVEWAKQWIAEHGGETV